MSTCMQTYKRIICMYACVYACMNACMYVCIYVYMHVYACIYVYMHVCMYICMHVCMYVYMYVCIHSDHFYNASSSSLLSEALQTQHTDTVPEFHAEALWATANEGLAQGPNVAAIAGFEPTILRLNQCATTSNVYV